jgi:hypothetical protein
MRYEPILRKSDLPEIQTLFATFDLIRFNSDADMVAQFDTELPVFGPVTISYFAREFHLKVFLQGQNDGEHDLLNQGGVEVTNREELIEFVTKALKKAVAEA